MNQREYLYSVKRLLDIEWDELALLANIKPRALKSYRMPQESSNYRTMPPLAFDAIERARKIHQQGTKRMTQIISIANQKGGVGKTTCTVNYGLALADAGGKCLFIDIDPQNNLGMALAKSFIESTEYQSSKANSYAMFESACVAQPFEVSDNVHVIGGDKRLGNLTQEQILNFADSIDNIKANYDFIFIDCPPSANANQHAALLISDKLLLISQAEQMSVKGVSEIVKTSRQIKRMNPNLELVGIVINLADKAATNDQRDHESKLRAEYGDLVFNNKVFRSVRVREAFNAGKSLAQVNQALADSVGFTATTNELLERLGAK